MITNSFLKSKLKDNLSNCAKGCTLSQIIGSQITFLPKYKIGTKLDCVCGFDKPQMREGQHVYLGFSFFFSLLLQFFLEFLRLVKFILFVPKGLFGLLQLLLIYYDFFGRISIVGLFKSYRRQLLSATIGSGKQVLFPQEKGFCGNKNINLLP